jgi:hypothetical protein
MDDRPATARPLRSTATVIALAALMLLFPGWAQAAAPPAIVEAPVIEGTPQVSQTLTARATWTGDPAPSVTWTWLQCSPDGRGCLSITGATSDSHVVTAAEIGSFLQVRLAVTNADGTVERDSAPTAVVTAAPAPEPTPPPIPEPTPPPIPEPTPPIPEPTPLPTPDPIQEPSSPEDLVESALGLVRALELPSTPVTLPDVVPQRTTPRWRMLKPFPVVRIRGVLTATGAHVTLLTVRAPRGVRISVRCSGRSCPVRRWARSAAVTRLTAFERHLRDGTRLDIAISRSGYIGKHTTIVIRRGAPPRRSDRCIYPTGGRPVRCPSH